MTAPRPQPELQTPAKTPETPRTRAIRAVGDSTELDAAYVAAILHGGDQLAAIADRLDRIADHVTEVVHHLDQTTAAVTAVAVAVEKLIPEERP